MSAKLKVMMSKCEQDFVLVARAWGTYQIEHEQLSN